MRRMGLTIASFVMLGSLVMAADKDADTPKAAATRKKLDQKISVAYKDTLLREVWDDLKDKVEGLGIRGDLKGGVNQNSKITYKAEDKPLGGILNEICDKNEMGFYIISKQNDAYDGTIYFTRGKERGYEGGKAVDAKPNPKSNPKDKEPAKEKPNTKEKPKPEPKPVEKPKTEKPKDPEPEDPDQKAERQANMKLATIKGVIEDGNNERAIELCQDLIKRFPTTKAAKEAKELLEKLNK